MSGLRILHSADWHIDAKRRFEPHVAALTWMITEGAARKVDMFLFAGDFAGLDAPHHLRTKELLTLVDLYSYAASIAPTVVIPGNHDEQEQFKIFDKIGAGLGQLFVGLGPGRRTYRILERSCSVTTLPWLPKRDIVALAATDSIVGDNERASNLLGSWVAKECDNSRSEVNLLVAHYGVPGGIMGSVEVSTAHDVVLDVEPFWSQYNYLAFGHLHRRQSIRGSGSPRRAWYSGSPVPLDFGETGRKGFQIIDIGEDGEPHVEFVPIPAWRMETLELQFNGITIDGPIAADYSNAYVRVNVNVPRDARLLKKLKLFSEVEKLIKKRGALGVKTNKIPIKPTNNPLPVFLSHTTIEDRLMQVMDEQQYDDRKRENVMAAFQSIRQVRRQREAESGHLE